MKELIESVKILANEEIERSMIEHPLFNSTHEGYAVIKEEVEEVQEEVELIMGSLEILWEGTKRNWTKESLIKRCEKIKKHSLLNAAESIQVAAMAQKFINSQMKVEQ